MAKETGILSKILAKETGYFSLKIGEEWYGGGKSAPNASQGDLVEVTYTTKEMNGRVYRNATAVVVVNKQATVARSAKEAVASMSDFGKDAFWKKKEERDIVNDSKRELGATRNTAVEIVNFAIDKGYLPALDKAKAQDKFDLYLSIIEGTTLKLITDSPHATAKAPAPKSSKTPVAAEEEEEDNEDND